DGIFFNDNGTILAVADPSIGVRLLGRNGGQLAAISIPGGPDGMAFHACSNSAFSINNDGSLWRINLTSYVATKFASGGSRGDIGAVGPDGCFYMNVSQSLSVWFDAHDLGSSTEMPDLLMARSTTPMP